MLPDDVLLEIFDFNIKENRYISKNIEAWQPLVHVCRRWRGVIFGSPRRLNLQLRCTPRTSRDMLDVWPALPLAVTSYFPIPGTVKGTDNVAAVLEHSDRVCRIDLHFDFILQAEKVWAAMQEPFPELENLKLSRSDAEQVIPGSFLGGSAPRLQYIELLGTPFPGLPKLLLSTPRLVTLLYCGIPHSGYVSPEALVTGLSRAPSLDMLYLGFRSLQSRPGPESRRPLPPTRTVLPALMSFNFSGAIEYLEDLVARIDAPRLDHFLIYLTNQFNLDIPQLVQFISRTPTLKAHDKAHVVIEDGAVKVVLLSTDHDLSMLCIETSFRGSNSQLSSLARATSSFPSLPMVESLYICGNKYLELEDWEDEIQVENTEWLDLLRPYTAVKNLYLSDVFGSEIVCALQGSVGSTTTVVLPTLQTVFMEGLQPSGPVQEDIGQFVAARQLSGYPCAISLWDEG